MSLDPHLLNLLVCPDCKLNLVYRRQGLKEDLICPKCRRIFSIRHGIPQLVPKNT